MAERRMFAKTVVATARFLKMPPTTRLLYFDLGMAADDDGIAEAFNVMRLTGATEDDLRVLVTKGYVRILNDDLVALIIDWKTNNLIRGDRYRQSAYAMLLKENDVHGTQMEPKWNPTGNQLATNWQPTGNQLATNWQPTGNQLATNWQPTGANPETQVRLGKYKVSKDSIGKDSIDTNNSNSISRSTTTTTCEGEKVVVECARDKKDNYPSKQDVRAYATEIGSTVDPDNFYDVYNATGWIANGNPIKSWKALFIAWSKAHDKKKNRALQYNQGVEYTIDDLKKLGISFGDEFYKEENG